MTSPTENVVAEWRAAMEEVPDGPWLYRSKRTDDWGIVRGPDDAEGLSSFVFQVRSGFQSEDELAAHRTAKTDPWGAMAKFIARCSPSGISSLLALIESQRATIERVERERDGEKERADMHSRQMINQNGRIAAAEARVTALEAEKAGAVKLADGYGIVLMMIAAGCSDPQRFAKRMLAEYAPEAKKMEATK